MKQSEKVLARPPPGAAIIEKLVTAGFVERKGKSLIPTKAGINLVTVLPEPLTSPMLTAEWEQKLTEIAKGGADPDTFMDGIRTMVREIVSTYSCISEDGKKLFAPEKESIAPAPAAASRFMRARITLRVQIGPAVLFSGKMSASGRAARRN